MSAEGIGDIDQGKRGSNCMGKDVIGILIHTFTYRHACLSVCLGLSVCLSVCLVFLCHQSHVFTWTNNYDYIRYVWLSAIKS